MADVERWQQVQTRRQQERLRRKIEQLSSAWTQVHRLHRRGLSECGPSITGWKPHAVWRKPLQRLHPAERSLQQGHAIHSRGGSRGGNQDRRLKERRTVGADPAARHRRGNHRMVAVVESRKRNRHNRYAEWRGCGLFRDKDSVRRISRYTEDHAWRRTRT